MPIVLKSKGLGWCGNMAVSAWQLRLNLRKELKSRVRAQKNKFWEAVHEKNVQRNDG